MKSVKSKVMEIHSASDGFASLQITYPIKMLPAPGQYLAAHRPGSAHSFLADSLFTAGFSSHITVGASTILNTISSEPGLWLPGTSLRLFGPLGRGFSLPKEIRRLALVALGNTAARLFPLIPIALDHGADITLFAQVALPQLPTAVEIHPLTALPEMVSWADFAAFDLPLESLSVLRTTLGLMPHTQLSCQAQALITSPMPCTGMAACGVCAVPVQRGYKLACKHGPVFDLSTLRW
jgi:NAD(P)H-flavin reductase